MDDEFVAGREAQRWRGEAPIVTSHELRQISCQAEAHLAELK
jgi:hypothetical protein